MNEKRYKEVYSQIMEVYKHVLLHTEDGERALNYLFERGFTLETIERFNFGYSFKGNMITKFLQSKGYDLEEMVEIGILRKFDKEPIYRDFFYGRIMIPICDIDDATIGFSGRVLPNNTTPIKYLNTVETAYFKKGQILYNLHNAKSSIKQNNFCILVEGYFDANMVAQKVSDNVVATMGTALTLEQVYQLKQYTNRVIICFDGDSAGIEATKRNAEILLQNGFDVRVAVIPNEYDPHEFLMKNEKEMFISQIIGKAKSYYSFMMNYLKNGKDMSLEINRLVYINEMLKVIQLAPYEKGKELFVHLTHEMNIDYNWINYYLDYFLSVEK